jgi:N-methylhydantoinase A
VREIRFREGSFRAAVYARDDLGAEAAFDGPLVVEQLDSTTVVPPGWRLSVDERGNLRLRDAS